MIVDFKNDPDNARPYVVVDAATWERIRLPIFYADDEAGLYRYYEQEPTGRPGVYKMKGEIEVRADIRIIRRPGMDA